VFETPLLSTVSRRCSEKLRRVREQYWPTVDYRIFELMPGAIIAASGVDDITGFGYLLSYSLSFASTGL
jgi:hypothetical protein